MNNNNTIFEGNGIIDPKILKKKIDNNENLVIIDSNEVYLKEYYDELMTKGYKVHILNFKDTKKSHSWNFLEYPYSLYKIEEIDKMSDILDAVTNTITFENNNCDPFWFLTSADLIQGIILGLFDDAEFNQINFKNIWLLLECATEKYRDENKLNVYFKSKNSGSLAYINASSTINAPVDTRNSIISVAKSRIKAIVSRENLNDVISGNGIKIEDFAKNKQALFIMIPELENIYTTFAPIFINELMVYLSTGNYPKCNILISNLSYITYVYNLEKFIQCSKPTIEFLINIVSKESFAKKYDLRAIENIRMEKTISIEYDSNDFKNYPTTSQADIAPFNIDKYFEDKNIPNNVVTNIDDIIREIDDRISKLEETE